MSEDSCCATEGREYVRSSRIRTCYGATLFAGNKENYVLEHLVLVYNLYSMLILLLGSFPVHASKMLVHSRSVGTSNIPSTSRRGVNTVQYRSGHDGRE